MILQHAARIAYLGKPQEFEPRTAIGGARWRTLGITQATAQMLAFRRAGGRSNAAANGGG